MSSIPWPLLAAIVSASFAFIYTQISKRIEFHNKRRSVAIALSVEVAEASESIASLRLSWTSLRKIAESEEKKPVIVISSDVKILSRTNLEELDFPPTVLIAITRFHNTIQEAYDFLDALNSDRFERMSVRQRVLVVDTTEAICEEVTRRAAVAYQTTLEHFPSKWFVGMSKRISARTQEENPVEVKPEALKSVVG